MAYIKTLKDNELVGGQDNTDVYPITSTQAVYSQKENGSAPEGKKVLLEERLTDMESQIEDLIDTPIGTDSIADEAVVTRKIADNAVTTSKIDTGAITSEKIASNAITNDKIADNTIAGNKFTDDSIDGSKIKDNSVPGSKLADGAIESIDLQDNTLSGSKLADNSVDGVKLVDGAVTSNKLKDNSIDGSKIADGTIQSLDIKDGTISGAKLANNTITGDKLANGIIDNNKIANNSITGDKFLDESISGEKIQANTIHGSKLETGTVDGADIIAGTLNGNKITDMSVDGDKLADDSIETRHIKSNTISGSKIVANSIDSTKIRNNSLIGENFADEAITNAKIVDDAVTNSKIANNTIASDKIADGAITTVKLANSSVGGTSIADNAITNGKLQDDSIVNRNIATGTLTGDKFIDNTITGDKIIDNTIPGSKIKDGTIENVDIKDNTLSGIKLVDNSISGSKIADNAITSAHLLDNSIPASKIQDGTIESIDIKDGTLDGSKIKDNTITGTKLADNVITSAKLSDNSVTTDKIANLSVTEGKIAANAVTSEKIGNGAVTEGKLGIGSVTADKITNSSVTETKLGTGAVTANKIVDNSVTTAKLADLNVTTTKIADGAVTEDKLADGAITSDKIADDAITELQTIMDEVPTKDSVKPVQSGGVQNELALGAVYDVSAKNPTAGTNSDGKWESLSALLSDANLDTLIPTAYRKGGMSIKFVQSSDNNYVQFRYIPSDAATVATFTNVANWQGVDDEPTAGSNNLVKSNGVLKSLNTIRNTALIKNKAVTKTGAIINLNGFGTTDYIHVDNVEYIKGICYDNTHNDSYIVALAWYDSNKEFISYYNKTQGQYYNNNPFYPILNIQKSEFPTNAAYFACTIFNTAFERGYNYIDTGSILLYIKTEENRAKSAEENLDKKVEDLINLFTETNKAVDTDGNIYNNTSMAITGYISVESVDKIEGIVYDNTHESAANECVGLAWFDSYKNFISYYDKTQGQYYDNNPYYPILNIQRSSFPVNAAYFVCTGYNVALERKTNYLKIKNIIKYINGAANGVTGYVNDYVNDVIQPIVTKTVTIAATGITWILTAEECERLKYLNDNVFIDIISISAPISGLVFSYEDENGNVVNRNTGSAHTKDFVPGKTIELFNITGARLYRLYHNNSLSQPVTLTLNIRTNTGVDPKQFIGLKETNERIDRVIASTLSVDNLDYFIPSNVYVVSDREARLYPKNLLSVNNDSNLVNLISPKLRSNQKFIRLVPNALDELPMQLTLFGNVVSSLGTIDVVNVTPTAPQSNLFILPIGDSLTYGANMDYHGCLANELSRLFNGIGTEIANGSQPLGYNNIKVIGTIDGSTTSVPNVPIKHEGRGGWSVEDYLTKASIGSNTNAFYNPTSQTFDLDYYLTENGFYTEGVATNGSNLIISIMLNWNSDPFDAKYLEDYRTLIENIHTSHPNAKILVVGCNCPPSCVYLTSGSGYNTSQDYQKRIAIKYENSLRQLASEYSTFCYHVPILPYYDWVNAYSYYDTVVPVPRDPSIVQRVYADSHHPNLIGYGQIADILFNYICGLFLGT